PRSISYGRNSGLLHRLKRPVPPVFRLDEAIVAGEVARPWLARLCRLAEDCKDESEPRQTGSRSVPLTHVRVSLLHRMPAIGDSQQPGLLCRRSNYLVFRYPGQRLNLGINQAALDRRISIAHTIRIRAWPLHKID